MPIVCLHALLPRAALPPRLSSRAAHTQQLRITARRKKASDSAIHVLGIVGVDWQAERVCSAPAKDAATTRDRNGVRKASRDRNHPLILEGLNAPWRQLIRCVALPEPSIASVAPSEELARCCHGTAGSIRSRHRAHLDLTQGLNLQR